MYDLLKERAELILFESSIIDSYKLVLMFDNAHVELLLKYLQNYSTDLHSMVGRQFFLIITSLFNLCTYSKNI